MGNQVSSQGWKKKKRRRKDQLDSETDGSENSDECEDFLEIEDVYEAQEHSAPVECRKEHSQYIHFQSLTLNNLCESIRHPALFEYIKARGNLVVKIKISEKSPLRLKEDPDGETCGHVASGHACLWENEIVEADCPRQNCQIISDSHHKVYGGVLVTTNRHVLVDDFEAENSEFHFFYDSEITNNNLVIGHGYALREDSRNKDYVGVKIYFHDFHMVEKIKELTTAAFVAWHEIPQDLQTEFEKYAVVISHPHGWAKRIAFGELLEKELEQYDEKKNQSYRVSKYTSVTCTGSSGSPVLTGFYWNNPFVHSSSAYSKKRKAFIGKSFFY